MQFFLKAVVTGFGLSLGGALFKKVAKELGLDEDKETEKVRQQDGVSDPDLQQQPSYS